MAATRGQTVIENAGWNAWRWQNFEAGTPATFATTATPAYRVAVVANVAVVAVMLRSVSAGVTFTSNHAARIASPHDRFAGGWTHQRPRLANVEDATGGKCQPGLHLLKT